LLWCVKVDTLGRLCDDNLERIYDHFTTTNVYFIGAAYNSYFLIIYKPSSLIISPRTFSTQLGTGTAWFCLSQCAIPFCTLSPEWSGITLEWKRVDNKSAGTTLASAHVLYLDLLSCVWLHISGGQNCCQKYRRGVVYRLIGVKMDIKDVNDFNLRTKELGCNYWSTYTTSGIRGVQVTSLHPDPIGVDNRSLGVKN